MNQELLAGPGLEHIAKQFWLVLVPETNSQGTDDEIRFPSIPFEITKNSG